MEVIIKLSDRKDKRYMAVFYDRDKKVKTTHFGYADGMGKYGGTYIDHGDMKKKDAWIKQHEVRKYGSTYIDHKNNTLKDAWIARHDVRGSFNDPMSASALARWVLWNKKTLRESIADYKRRFKLD